ncbi:MAG: SpoVR family protein [Nanoarchaeota archaeon]|nr:SpoVR family protein [Nanoarchaeota archaeon]
MKFKAKDSLDPELEEDRKLILADAKEYGLKPLPTIFKMVSHGQLNQLVSYGGFPIRYHHWTHGRKSLEHGNREKFGLESIFELVINNNPAWAYLVKSNNAVINRLVISHVYGHSDFFANNIWFEPTDRDMINTMEWHDEKVTKYSNRYGDEKVEEVLNLGLMVDSLIDSYSIYRTTRFEKIIDRLKEKELQMPQIKLHSTGDRFLDKLLNTKEYFEKEQKRIKKDFEARKKFPRELQMDILKFLIDNGKMNNINIPLWKIDILRILRDEAYYFVPQTMTKIMNEGWACYWHEKLMIEKGHVKNDLVDFCQINSSVLQLRKGEFSPYSWGLALYKWIEKRWNEGRFGKEYDECNDLIKKQNWDTKAMQGREMLFYIRTFYDDITFLNRFFDQEFCDAHDAIGMTIQVGPRQTIFIKHADFIKKQIINSIYNQGMPLIYVKDGNYKNKGELLLYHKFNNRTLDLKKAFHVMKGIRKIWGKDTSLETKIQHEKGDEIETHQVIYTATEKTIVKTVIIDGEELVEEVEL